MDGGDEESPRRQGQENKDLKGQLRQAKDEAVREYRDSDALLSELGASF